MPECPAAPPASAVAPRGQRRAAPLATFVAGLLCAGVGGVTAGRPGLVAGLLATAVVAGFFWSGLVPLLFTRDKGSAGLALVVLLVNYVLRLVVALALLGAVTRSGAADSGVVGVTVVVCALTWGAAQAALLRR